MRLTPFFFHDKMQLTLFFFFHDKIQLMHITIIVYSHVFKIDARFSSSTCNYYILEIFDATTAIIKFFGNLLVC